MLPANKAVTTTIDELFAHRPLTKRPAYLAQPKIYGVRARWDANKQKLFTRQGNEITSLPHIVNEIKNHPLSDFCFEGELYSQLINFDELQGIVRRELNTAENRFLRRLHTARVYSIHLYIFDVIMPKMATKDRGNLLMANSKDTPYLYVLPNWLICNEEEASNFYFQCVDQGFEGIVLRNTCSFYEDKKSLLRIKPVNALDCIYLGWKNQAALRLETHDGIEFYCSGMSERSRDTIQRKFKKGDIVPILHDSFSPRGVPTFARVNNDMIN